MATSICNGSEMAGGAENLVGKTRVASVESGVKGLDARQAYRLGLRDGAGHSRAAILNTRSGYEVE